MFSLPTQVNSILNKLNSAGFEAYIVGGCVRDLLLGITPTDYDITTSATPDEMLEIFKENRIIETGIKHGTLTVIEDDMPFEITTYRIDDDYTDNRHPNAVVFTRSLSKDLARRDFTVNAMAYHPKKGITDNFDGIVDLKSKLIRTVGNPNERFLEDALRIMRGIRFASVLDFDIEEKTADAIIQNKNLLKNVSNERICSEFIKLLCGKNAGKYLKAFAEVVNVILPEAAQNISKSNFSKTINSLPSLPHIRLAAVLSDADVAVSALKRLRLDNATINKIQKLLKHRYLKINPNKSCIKKHFNMLTSESFFELITLQRADGLLTDDEYNKLTLLANKIIDNNECYSLSALAVTGNDLLSLGMKSGADIGSSLEFLLDAVINEKVKNQKDDLINYLSKNKKIQNQ